MLGLPPKTETVRSKRNNSIVNNPYDEIAWIRFLTFWDGIGEVRASRILQQVIQQVEEIDIPSILQNAMPGEDGHKISKLYESIREKKEVGAVVDEAYKEMSLGLAFRYRNDWEEKRKDDFPVLRLLATSYPTLGEFIGEGLLDNSEQMNGVNVLSQSMLGTEEVKDHVIISTIHSAKGLEADVCIVLNVSPKAFPSAWSLDNLDEIEEDRRVLYVALTRAKNRLIISRNTASVAAVHKQTIPNPLGGKNFDADYYFLNELPENLVYQQAISHQFGNVRDADTPNTIDLSSGMDFS